MALATQALSSLPSLRSLGGVRRGRGTSRGAAGAPASRGLTQCRKRRSAPAARASLRAAQKTLRHLSQTNPSSDCRPFRRLSRFQAQGRQRKTQTQLPSCPRDPGEGAAAAQAGFGPGGAVRASSPRAGGPAAPTAGAGPAGKERPSVGQPTRLGSPGRPRGPGLPPEASRPLPAAPGAGGPPRHSLIVERVLLPELPQVLLLPLAQAAQQLPLAPPLPHPGARPRGALRRALRHRWWRAAVVLPYGGAGPGSPSPVTVPAARRLPAASEKGAAPAAVGLSRLGKGRPRAGASFPGRPAFGSGGGRVPWRERGG